MGYTDKFDRSNADDRTAREIPEDVVAEIIKDQEEASAVLQVANTRTLRAYQTRFRLQDSFPEVYWLKGTDDVLDGPGDGSVTAKDSAFKQTTSFGWKNKYLTPEEIAVIARMPDNWRQDSDIAWEEVRSAIRTAAAKAIDRAILFGDATGGLPDSFGDGLVAEALAAGAFTILGTNEDRADDYAAAAEALAEIGYDVDAFLARNAELWKIKRLRDNEGRPLFGDLGFYGLNLVEVKNGAWDQTEATAVAGDWKQLVVGIRKDMEWFMSREAPLFNPATGALVYAPFQQDGELMRFCMRLGYEVLDPIKNVTGEREFPFHVIVPAGYSA